MEEETIKIELPLVAFNSLSLQSIGYLASVLAFASKGTSQTDAAEYVEVIQGDIMCSACQFELIAKKFMSIEDE